MESQEVYRDEIVREVQRIKEEHAAQYGYDIDAMVRALREMQQKSGRKVVTRARRRGGE